MKAKRSRQSKSLKYRKRLFCFKEDQYIQDKVRSVLGNGKWDVLWAKISYLLHKGIVDMVYMKERYQKKGFAIRKRANPKYLEQNRELHYGTLNHLFGGSDSFNKQLIDWLILWGIIYIHQEYIPSVSSTRYRFTERWENEAVVMRPFTGIKKSLIWKLVEGDWLKAKHPISVATQAIYDNYISLSDALLETIKKKYNHPVIDDIVEAYPGGYLKDNRDDFAEAMSQVPYDRSDVVLLMNFLLQDFYCKDAKDRKRLQHPINYLKREYRPGVLIEGKPIIEVDLVNSQPTFSAGFLKLAWHHAMKQVGLPTDLPDDFLIYEQLCLTGQFYEAIAREAGIVLTSDNRGDFKQDFFKYIFYSRVKVKDNPIKDAFIKLFPNVYKAINGIKALNYKKFAVMMQDHEADLMVFSVYRQMLEEGFKCLVLHDAILCNSPEAEKRAKELIRDEFMIRYNQHIRFTGESVNEAIEPVLSAPEPTFCYDELESQIEAMEGELIDEEEDTMIF
jgi:hypothetical protein